MRSGLFLPPFDELAEEGGWDGMFVWDHVRRRQPVLEVADPQISPAAVATATTRIRFGPMVTRLRDAGRSSGARRSQAGSVEQVRGVIRDGSAPP